MMIPNVVEKANNKFAHFARSDKITIRKNQVISRDDKIFTIGSCFAEEIRKALARTELVLLPRYSALEFNKDEARVDELPEREHLNYYNSFTILQEFQRMSGAWLQDEDDFWTVRGAIWPGAEYYQDPYRRLVFAQDRKALQDVMGRLNSIMVEGFREANVFIITYGMVEVFVNQFSGLVASQKPLYFGGGGAAETVFKQSTYEENLQNIRNTINIIKNQNPDAKIFVTVSPVALERTFSEDDIVVANTEGKSLLRAALAQICREFDKVFYFPAYELVINGGASSFEKDRRHVKPEVVASIMNAFSSAYLAFSSQ